MKIGEEIKIVSHKNTYIYKITEKHTINDDDMSYFKKIDNSLSDVCITSSNYNGYYNFKISGTNIFVDENYDMNIFVYNECS